jgi:hypothetical protein
MTVAMEELRKHYEWIDNQNEVGTEESMSAAAATSIGGGNKRPSPESNSSTDGGSVSKKDRVKRHVFTPHEKEILVNLYNTNKIKDTKGIHDVVVLLSKDDRTLSETQPYMMCVCVCVCVYGYVCMYTSVPTCMTNEQLNSSTDPRHQHCLWCSF